MSGIGTHTVYRDGEAKFRVRGLVIQLQPFACFPGNFHYKYLEKSGEAKATPSSAIPGIVVLRVWCIDYACHTVHLDPLLASKY